MTDTNVIPLRPRADAPVQRLSGLRKPSPEAMALANIAMGLARADDDEAQLRIKRLAREARNAFDGKHVCPSLVMSIAARATGLASQAEALAEEAKSLGLLKACSQLRDHAGLLEKLSAELEADLPEGA